MRCSVNDHQLDTIFPALIECRGKFGRLDVCDSRRLSAPSSSPYAGRLLRVSVDELDADALAVRFYGEMDGEGCFSRTAFLRHHSQHVHGH
jgi:hypothetical protein